MTAITAPLVSVLLPVFNAGATVGEAVASILGQTLTDLELVVVNDGSTDDSMAAIRETAGDDGRVRIVEGAHGGVVAATRLGLPVCSGTFLARMDADDVSLPDRLAAQVELLDNPQLSVASCLVEILDPSPDRPGFNRYVEWVNSLVEADDIAREIYIESPVPNPTTMVRRAELVELGGYADTDWPEDYELWLRYNSAGRAMAKVPEILHLWRDAPTRLTRTDPRYATENFIRAKCHHLVTGPLATSQSVIVWGAGKIGRIISAQLIDAGVEIDAVLDIDPKKIGGSVSGAPVHDADELPGLRRSDTMVLVAVPTAKARALIRGRLAEWGMVEMVDYWCVA